MLDLVNKVCIAENIRLAVERYEMNQQLPEERFLVLPEIIGQTAVTEEEAQANRERNMRAAAEARAAGRIDKGGKPKFKRRPTSPRPAIRAIIPVKRTCWWDGVRSGRFPKPVKIGNGRGVFWRVSDIRALIETVSP
jgi:predicted DNA-binding transcriptional regulator AlpA